MGSPSAMSGPNATVAQCLNRMQRPGLPKGWPMRGRFLCRPSRAREVRSRRDMSGRGYRPEMRRLPRRGRERRGADRREQDGGDGHREHVHGELTLHLTAPALVDQP